MFNIYKKYYFKCNKYLKLLIKPKKVKAIPYGKLIY